MADTAGERLCPSCLAANDAVASTCGYCGSSLVGSLGPGTVLSGRYELLETLGSGGMGVVFKARDRTLEEVVALKLLRPDSVGLAAARRFRSEIKLARRVAHRNVCRIFEYGEDDSARFIVMELLVGQTLRALVRSGSIAAERVLEMGVQAAEGLSAIHDAGIVHRDVKTPNLLLGEDGVVRVMDFGIAKQMGAAGVTGTGLIVGSPEYMSPEQASGGEVDARSDLYSLGIVLYEMFTGRPPFRGDTPITTLWKQMNEPPVLRGGPADAIPPEVLPLLERLLAKSPNDRPSSAHEVTQALRLVQARLNTQTIATTVATTASRAPVRTGRTVLAALTLAVIVTLIAIVLGVGWIGYVRWSPPQPSHAANAPNTPRVPTTAAPLPTATVPLTLAPTLPPRPRPARSAASAALPRTTRRPAAPVTPERAVPVVSEKSAVETVESEGIPEARAALDAILARGGELRFPMAREKLLGFDPCVLVVGPAAVRLMNEDGTERSASSLAKVVVEGIGEAKPVLTAGDRSPGHFIRLKVDGHSYRLYFVPPHAICRKVQRVGSANSFPQCDSRGAEQQETVATYLAETLARLAAPAR